METLIYCVLLTIATIAGTVFALQLLNMVAVIIRGKGSAQLDFWPPIIWAVCLYLMNKL